MEGILLARGILNVYLDLFLGAIQMPLLQQGPPLASDSYLPGFYCTLTHSPGNYPREPELLLFKPMSHLSLGMPGSSTAGRVLCACPPPTPPLTNEHAPSKSEILVFIIK